ncbi:MAG: NADH-quinone oxidoreductase subunit J [Gemmataceae bacterium]|nr:NADH-quinone oxidoreductase subunit J [Gemmataceae bacterium]
MTPTLFYILAGLTAISALGVVVSQNIVRAATWLLFALAGTAGIFFLLGAEFLGATQLLVYVGGTLVLVVFGVMLTASGPFVNMRVSAAEWAINLGVGLLLYGVLAVVLVQVQGDGPAPDDSRSLAPSKAIGMALLGAESATAISPVTGSALKDRDRKRMSYLLPFEIVSVHLLVVLIGAAYLARAKRRRQKEAKA